MRGYQIIILDAQPLSYRHLAISLARIPAMDPPYQILEQVCRQCTV